MKSLKYLVVAALLGASLAFMRCSSPSGPTTTAQDDLLKKLSGKAWKVQTVTFNNLPDLTYTNFALTITGTKGSLPFDYSTAGRPATSPWPAAGKFTFSTTDFSQIVIRDDNNLPVNYVVSATALQLTFTYAGTGFAGRVAGSWVFTFGL